MVYDPLTEVTDEQLMISAQTVQELERLRNAEKFADLPGFDKTEEQDRLSQFLNELLSELAAGVEAHPNKLWVMGRFQLTLKRIEMEDTEGRERFGEYLEQIMDVLNIESSDGLINFYL